MGGHGRGGGLVTSRTLCGACGQEGGRHVLGCYAEALDRAVAERDGFRRALVALAEVVRSTHLVGSDPLAGTGCPLCDVLADVTSTLEAYP